MDASRIARLTELFERALTVQPAHRAMLLEEACGDDPALREELASLLMAHESATEFFDDLAVEIVAPAYAAFAGAAHPTGDSALLQRMRASLGNTYRIEQELGGGAMSRVFLAEEIRLRRKVVIKVLPPERTAGVNAERFRREIQLAAQLQHPHIVPLLTTDSTDDLLWYSMPYVAGESLRGKLAREGALSLRAAGKIWRDVLDALMYAHTLGVVHRDIKPGNILVSGRNALVSDFGIAHAIEAAVGDVDTAAGLSIGTPGYMAPEQVAGDHQVDHRADLYAAALVMYEMLEGRSPFVGESRRERMLARLSREPRGLLRSDCPRPLAELVLQCLARDPEARPATAEAVLADLENAPRLDADTNVNRTDRTADQPRSPLPATADARSGTTSARVGGSAATGRRARRVLGYALAALTAATALFVVGHVMIDRARTSGRAEARTPSIVVLPLTNSSLDTVDATLADGMTDELSAVLSRGGTLRVIPGPSVLALQSRRLDMRQIAESLGVSLVLEGVFRKAGSRLHLEVRLEDPRDGTMRWSETYDREMKDIFATQEDIARAVALALDVRLGAGGRRGSTPRRHTPNIAAYEWYLRGMNTALLRSDSGRRQGLEYFDRAIAADPDFAAAYAGQVWLFLGEAGESPGDHQEWFARGREAALKAVALDESLPQAHSALGWARIVHREWAAAEVEFKQAIALDPGVHRGYEGLARTYMLIGRPAEQLTAARIGLEVDPYSHSAIREMALALDMNDRCDEALELLRPLKALSPPAGVAGVIMGLCYAGQQRWSEAIGEFRWARQNSDARAALAFLGYALARSGRRDEAMNILSDLLAGREYSHGAFGIAVIYAGLRDYDRAFAWLAKAENESSSRVYIRLPLFEDLHRDPRFAQLMNGQRN